MPWGAASRDHLRAIVPARVYLRRHDTARYGRQVAEVMTLDGDNLNLRMFADGWAAVYRQYCKDSDFTRREDAAKAQGLGIWAQPGEHQTPCRYRHREP